MKPIILPFIFLLLAVLIGTGTETAEDRIILNLDEYDPIRISLFSHNPPESLRLTADSASIQIFSNDVEIKFSNLSLDFALTHSKNQLFLETTGLKLPIDSLRFESGSSPARLITEQFGYRYYNGSILLKPDIAHEAITLINEVDLEEYVASVVGSEMNFETPDALKAQAVVSRTYALWSVATSTYSDFDLKDYEANQVYVGYIRDKPHYRKAAEDTKGEIITWSDQLILAVYSSTCGGNTANNEDVWNGKPHPYLRSQQDGQMCSLSPHFRWSYTTDRAQLKTLIRRNYGFNFTDQSIERDQSERVQHITLFNQQSEQLSFTGNEFRLLLNKTFGPLAVRSTHFTWHETDEHITFSGAGLGHGVGMCQWGALGFAENGWSYKEILSFYFSGTKIVNLEHINSNHLPLYQ